MKTGVIGSGMMGSEIALVMALAGHDVVMMNPEYSRLEVALDKIRQTLNRLIERGKVQLDEPAETVLARLQPFTSMDGLSGCELVVEAIIESLEAKKHILAQALQVIPKDAILTSNTSSISITALSADMTREDRQRFLGTHFNSPASQMKLVEVIPGLDTTEEVVNQTIAYLEAMGKIAVRVKDVPGFALNRMFHAFYLEATRLLEEGVCSVDDVDTICIHGLGHPMGIFALLDLTGHDLNLAIDEILFDAYGERFRPSQYMRHLVEVGRLGRKTKAGFYNYAEKKGGA